MDKNLKAILARIQANLEADHEVFRDRLELWRKRRARVAARPKRRNLKRRLRSQTWIILIVVVCVGILGSPSA